MEKPKPNPIHKMIGLTEYEKELERYIDYIERVKMENSDKTKTEVSIETNNDAVLYSLMRSFLNKKSKEFNVPIEELYLQTYKDNKILLLKDDYWDKGVGFLQEIEV